MEKKSNSVQGYIKVKSRKELAQEYGISIRTLHRWLKQENITIPSGLLKPKTIKKIYEKFGKP